MANLDEIGVGVNNPGFFPVVIGLYSIGQVEPGTDFLREDATIDFGIAVEGYPAGVQHFT